ncbi:diguanylate cyclase [Paragemmobacter straminiformis]|uniref:diguanylate cyclase n=1 Tax=Paragemmobacter straminiformis TaxID=2045119 RepID=A0A842IBN5_9RHOB|nr:diguanylate cyclase [Gemmobacter straminiformis]MBC2837095.1 diguanylate cyclase [Gemmobacter straminiformis]
MAGRILIVEDCPITRIVLRAKLGLAFYTPLAAPDGASAIAALREEAPDLVLLDLDLPDMSGLEVLATLRRSRARRDVPVIVLTAATDRTSRLEALGAGADDILTKPVNDELLLARIRSLLRRQSDTPAAADAPGNDMADPPATFERPGFVAVVTRRTEDRLRLARDLARRTGHCVTPLSREEVLAHPGIAAAQPEAFVLDDGASNGLHFVSEIRTRTATSHAGVVLLCDGAKQAAMAFDLGADEVLPSSVDPEELALRLSALIRRTRAAEERRLSLRDSLRLAMTDPLTGLHNRRYALAELGNIAATAHRTATPFALMLVDIDRFKSVNDRFGHGIGDRVLVSVARSLAANLRPEDLIARIGGEEFLLALPCLDLSDARRTAQRLCDAVKSAPVSVPGSPPVTVTVSVGLAIGRGGETLDRLIDRADRALFSAKAKGRNRVATDLRAAAI